MKKSILLAASLLAFNFTPVFGQPGGTTAPPPANNYQQRLQAVINAANPPQNQPSALTKFNLDFPGGTPKALVAAIEKAMGKPVNVIIADEDAAMKLPPLKLNEVTFPQLSDTLRAGSTKTEYVLLRNSGGGLYNQGVETGYYFRTTDDRPTDNSVWFFHVTKKPEQPPLPPVEKACRFYSLDPYLNRGFTVDDITTAIQTGWKMAGVTPTPELNYHKETKLLIALGKPDELKTIDDVLKTLPPGNSTYTDLQSLYRNLNTVNDRLNKLQHEVDQLTKTNSMPAASPLEKSGK